MNLEKIITDFSDINVYGQTAIEINKLTFNSAKVEAGDVFFAQKGLKTNGHFFIQQAIDSGAKCIILENKEFLTDEYCNEKNITRIIVKNCAKAMALAANAFFGYPTEKMKLVGITGTNGKTTTSYLIKSILENNGEKTGLIGTINYMIGNESFIAGKTTPESTTLFELFRKMKDSGVNSAIMEVSSHSLALDRVYGLKFDVAAFTNLTQDHLDFHINFEDYLRSKKILFDINLKSEGCAVYNSDDSNGGRIVSGFKGRKISYGLNSGDLKGSISKMTFDGIDLDLNYYDNENINSKLIGRFNAYNLLTAASVAKGLNIKWNAVKEGLENISNISGRFHKLYSPKGYYAIVDYSHTPDSLYNALITISEVIKAQKNGRIITVFGCGGDRDKTKRPEMGRIATELSDTVIITTDNPRNEEPRDIIAGILSGIEDTGKIEVIENRKAAIEFALSNAKSGDIVLIAGKGHEDYQEIKGIKHHFDDAEIILEQFNKE